MNIYLGNDDSPMTHVTFNRYRVILPNNATVDGFGRRTAKFFAATGAFVEVAEVTFWMKGDEKVGDNGDEITYIPAGFITQEPWRPAEPKDL